MLRDLCFHCFLSKSKICRNILYLKRFLEKNSWCSLVLPWFCLGSSLVLLGFPWFCLGSALVLPWFFLVLPWFFLGSSWSSLVLPWFSLGSSLLGLSLGSLDIGRGFKLLWILDWGLGFSVYWIKVYLGFSGGFRGCPWFPLGSSLVLLGFLGSSWFFLVLPWFSLGFPWFCLDSALVLPWFCLGSSLVLPWFCLGSLDIGLRFRLLWRLD